MSDRTSTGMARGTSLGIRMIVAFAAVMAFFDVIHELRSAFGATDSPWQVDVVVEPWRSESLPAGELSEPGASESLYLVDAGPIWLGLLLASGAVIRSLAVIIGAAVLPVVVDLIAKGRPFEPGNPRRLSVLALLVAIGGAGSTILRHLAAGALLSHYEVPSHVEASLRDVVPWIFWSLAAASLLFLIGQAFRNGARLARDIEGLV